MNAKTFRIGACLVGLWYLSGTCLYGAIFVPTVDGIIYDGEPFGARDGVPDHFAENSGGLDVFNATPLEGRSVIEFALGRLNEPVTSARLPSRRKVGLFGRSIEVMVRQATSLHFPRAGRKGALNKETHSAACA